MNKKGFSLIELLIVIAIFSIMTTVLVANQRKFGNNIILSGLANDVALSIREAQTYGLGSKDVDNQGSFNNPYGVYFSSAKRSEYKFFADTNNVVCQNPAVLSTCNSGIEGYDGDGGDDAVMRTMTLPAGNVVDHFCVIPNPNSGLSGIKCSNDASNPITEMSVTFLRPQPDAIIVTGGNHYEQATICLRSQTGKTKQVDVLVSGQIDVVDTCN